MILGKKIIGFSGQGASDSALEVGNLLSKLRGDKYPSAMTLLGVVAAFDPGKYCQVGFGTSFEGLAVNELALKVGAR